MAPGRPPREFELTLTSSAYWVLLGSYEVKPHLDNSCFVFSTAFYTRLMNSMPEVKFTAFKLVGILSFCIGYHY